MSTNYRDQDQSMWHLAGPSATSTRTARGGMARIAGVGVGALVVAGALVGCAAQPAAPDLGSPDLASASSSPGNLAVAPSGSEGSSTEPEPTDGAQPELLAGTPLKCGANLADLTFAEHVRLAATGDLTTESVYYEGEWHTGDELPLRAADATGAGAPEDDLNFPAFVWFDEDGTVVDLGGWAEYPMFLSREDGDPTVREDRTSTCAPEGAEQWLADGGYTVYPMTIEYSTDTLVAGDPVEATIVDGEPRWAAGGQEAPVPFEMPGDPDQTLLPERALGSVVVDRTGQWERRDTYRVVRPESDLTEGEAYVLQARCTSSDVTDRVTYELIGNWGGVTGEIACDGHDRTDGTWPYQAPVVPGEPVGVELTDVPDGVALAYAVLVPGELAED